MSFAGPHDIVDNEMKLVRMQARQTHFNMNMQRSSDKGTIIFVMWTSYEIVEIYLLRFRSSIVSVRLFPNNYMCMHFALIQIHAPSEKHSQSL